MGLAADPGLDGQDDSAANLNLFAKWQGKFAVALQDRQMNLRLES
jgi:hypothetical protein